jgi:hypothetical protein
LHAGKGAAATCVRIAMPTSPLPAVIVLLAACWSGTVHGDAAPFAPQPFMEREPEPRRPRRPLRAAPDIEPLPLKTFPCDAQGYTDRGDRDYAAHAYRAALASYEDALRCRPDPIVETSATLAACASHDAPRARTHFPRARHADQQLAVAVCARYGVDPHPLQPAPVASCPPLVSSASRPAPGCGIVRISSLTATEVLLDQDTVPTQLPATLHLAAGVHRFAFWGTRLCTRELEIRAGIRGTYDLACR